VIDDVRSNAKTHARKAGVGALKFFLLGVSGPSLALFFVAQKRQ